VEHKRVVLQARVARECQARKTRRDGSKAREACKTCLDMERAMPPSMEKTRKLKLSSAT
jgi:hypothetical protein